MKTKTGKLILTLAVILGIGFLASCGDDDGGGGSDANKDALEASIDQAEDLLANTEEGSEEGQYLEGSKDDLQAVLTPSIAVFNDDDATQTEVNNTNQNLQAAIEEYEGNLIEPISPDNLVAHWKFNEGTGTTVEDASGNGHDGTLTLSHESFDTPEIPTWAADRNGDAGKALHFDNGAHIEIPANAAFNPQQMTISLWVKPDEMWPENYIMAQNTYKGWKFQLQSVSKPFLTVSYGTDLYINKDIDNGLGGDGLPNGEWHHIAVSFKNGEMVFYVDGQEVWTWTDDAVKHNPITIAELNDFVIGVDLPNAKVPEDISWVLAHFRGSMDEVRFYNTVLTEAQIAQIYNIEE